MVVEENIFAFYLLGRSRQTRHLRLLSTWQICKKARSGMRGISLPRVGATATKGGPCGPRDSKRGQRITKNTDRRSNTLSSLSLILPSFLPSFLRERNHLTHALGGGGGGSSQSVPFPYERTPNLQTWSSPFSPPSLARSTDRSTETLDTRKKSAI